ncbi:hypothetical protein [Bradyrhizobium sp. ORS 285]|uniref:hypothetical protein n=1 Tax=Bradyrhizobium sp. ORS 285 TaxID=115808 RepID=UPI0012FB07A2|nr:hypothetical protein [Bradyrhizobium sp. ORS 285]
MQDTSDFTPNMHRAIVCRAMGWTYDEYDRQPADFLLTVATMLQSEAEHEQKKRGTV